MFFACNTQLSKGYSSNGSLNHIDLATSVLDKKYNPAIQAALVVGKNLLNKYYNILNFIRLQWVCFLQQWSLFYFHFWISVTIVLHPSHKLDYFKATDWETEWVSTAEEIVHAEFNCTYANIINVDSNLEESSVHGYYAHFNPVVNLICTTVIFSIYPGQYIQQSPNTFCTCQSRVRWQTYSLLGCTNWNNFEPIEVVDW